jgi:hypothetical protein
MKANNSSKLKNDNKAFARVVGGLVALLITIIVGICLKVSVRSLKRSTA